MRNSLKLLLVCLTLIMSHTISFAIHDDDKKGKDVPIVVTDKTTDHQRSLTPEIKVYYFPYYETVEVHHYGLGECSITVYDANVEALAESENGGACTGPKEMDYWLGRIYCHSTNANPCSDNYGCN